MSLIYEQVHKILVASERIESLKLGTSGRSQDCFYIASKDEMREFFRVISSGDAGDAGLVGMTVP